MKLLHAAESVDASELEKAVVLAVASIETEKMIIDYPLGDNKAGDAYNISIFKLNLGMIKKVDPTADLDQIHNDNEKAAKFVIKAIRKYGLDTFLKYHRGGEGAFTGRVEQKKITPYIRAILAISEAYMQDKWQLIPESTDDYRYTIFVPAI